jgi:hypothetical protein
VRLLTPDDYYVVRANALEENVRFYRVVKGRREQLQSRRELLAPARAAGARRSIHRRFDDKNLFTAVDKTFAAAGKVALWTSIGETGLAKSRFASGGGYSNSYP